MAVLVMEARSYARVVIIYRKSGTLQRCLREKRPEQESGDLVLVTFLTTHLEVLLNAKKPIIYIIN